MKKMKKESILLTCVVALFAFSCPANAAPKKISTFVVVAKKDVGENEKISKEHIEIKKIPILRVPLGSLRSLGEVIGKTPKLGFSQGMIIKIHDLSAHEMPVFSSVVVAKKPLPSDTTIGADDLEVKQLDLRDIPPEAVRFTSTIIGEKLIKPLQKGQCIMVTNIESLEPPKEIIKQQVVYARKNIQPDAYLSEGDMKETAELALLVPPEANSSIKMLIGRKVRAGIARGTIVSQYDLVPKGFESF